MATLYRHVPTGTLCRLYSVRPRSMTGRYIEMVVEYTNGHLKKGTIRKLSADGQFSRDNFIEVSELLKV